MADSPTFLIRRNGIFYFQARIPQNSVLHMKYKKKLIRKSTRTGNKREAMRIARTWWVELMTEQEPGESFDDYMEREDMLYSTGACLYPRYGDIDPRDEETLGHLSAFEREALDVYKEEQKKRRIEQRVEELEIEREARQAMAKKYQPEPQEEISNTPSPFIPELGAAESPVSKKLSELAEEHAHHYINISKEWTVKTPQAYKSRLKLFIHMVGDMPAQELTPDMVRERYAQKLHKLPLYIEQRKKFKNGNEWKPIDEIIAIAGKCGDQVISNRTISSYVKVVNKFLKATLINDYGCAPNLAKPLKKYVYKNDEKEVKERVAFTEAEHKALFESEDYRTGKWMRYPERHWIPLIAFFTGARLGEIAQLDINDIAFDKESGFYFMDINDRGDKHLKTITSRRDVPIHPVLIDLGLARYQKIMRARKEKRLFPREKPDKYGSRGRNTSRWFNGQKTKDGFKAGYKHKCGIKIKKGEDKVFHCFRNSFINQAKQDLLNEKIIREIVGHAHGRSDAHSNYASGYNRKTKAAELMKMTGFDKVDFSVIKRWP